jgi:hypothetical protein
VIFIRRRRSRVRSFFHMKLELDLRRKSGFRGEEQQCQDCGCLRLGTSLDQTAIPDADDDIGDQQHLREDILRFCLITKRENAVPIADQRPAGFHPPSLGAIPILRTNVQSRRTSATATTSERWFGLGVVPATI